MAGIKGKSGGKREGAGRKIQKFTLRLNAQYTASTETPDGFLPPQLATVVEVSRKFVKLRLGNGDIQTISR